MVFEWKRGAAEAARATQPPSSWCCALAQFACSHGELPHFSAIFAIFQDSVADSVSIPRLVAGPEADSRTQSVERKQREQQLQVGHLASSGSRGSPNICPEVGDARV